MVSLVINNSRWCLHSWGPPSWQFAVLTAKGNAPEIDTRDIMEHMPRALLFCVFYTPNEVHSNGSMDFLVDFDLIVKIKHSQITITQAPTIRMVKVKV